MSQTETRILRKMGLKIRLPRLDPGLSQETLAIEAKVGMNYVSRIERGAKNPTILVLSRIAKVLRISVGDLFIAVSSRETCLRIGRISGQCRASQNEPPNTRA